MTANDKISLVDQMIKEDRDYTVKDFVNMVSDIERVEQSTFKFKIKYNGRFVQYGIPTYEAKNHQWGHLQRLRQLPL